MNRYPALRRGLAVGVTLAVFAGVLAVLGWPGAASSGGNRPAEADSPKAAAGPPVAMFGQTVQRNMVNLTEKNVPTEWDVRTGKNIKWSATLGSKSYALVIHAGKVFCGSNNDAPRDPAITGDKGIIMCFQEDNGTFLWQAVHDKLPSGLVHDWPKEGVCSTPAVEGNRLYYVSNRCEVVCATTEGLGKGNEGEQDEKYKGPQKADFVWRYDMMKDLNVFPHNLSACSPLLVGDVLFVVTANGVDENHKNIPAPEAPSFIALNKKTGQLLWKSNAPGRRIMHGQWSNPVYAAISGKPQVIFPGGDGWLRGFEPDTGKLIWKFDANPKSYPEYELGGKGLRSDFIATPVVSEGKVYIGTGQDPEHYEGMGHLWCIDPTKAKPGQEDISPELAENPDQGPPFKGKPNPNSGAVWHYGGPDNAPNAKRDYIFGRTMSTCAIHDGLVYAGELAGYLHCLDARTGQRYWVHDLKSAVWGSPYWVDGKVYIGTEDGDVWIFEHGKEAEEGKPKKPPAKIEMGQPIRSTPAASNGTLFVLCEQTLYAIKK